MFRVLCIEVIFIVLSTEHEVPVIYVAAAMVSTLKEDFQVHDSQDVYVAAISN